jgi:recombination protein RecA
VAALVPRAEIEGDMGDSHVGLHARLMSQAMRKLAGAISKSNCVVIFINQLRLKVGVVYGNPEVTTGGNALKYYASVRIDIRRTETLKNGTEMIGSRTRAKIVKNKVAPPYREAEFDILYGSGISRMGELLDLSVKFEIVQKGGAWFSYGDIRLGQGRDNSRNFLIEHPEIAAEIEKKLWDKVKAQKEEALRARPAAKAAAAPAADAAVPDAPAAPAAPAPTKSRAARSSAAAKTNIDIAVDD